MEKKEFKFYESPVMEIVEAELEGFLCASGSNAENAGAEGGEEGEDL